jgi:hypothetical protein
MTIVDIKNQIISHLFDNDSFDLEVDGPKLTLSDDLLSVRDEVITTVMGELEDMKMIRRVASGEKDVWLLTQPFDSFSQSIILGASTSEILADTINSFRDANDIDADVCDKTKISEHDILNLLNICHALLDSDMDIFDDDDDMDEDEKE